MTLHEIEETLRTLASRHSGLTESQLLTLLRAGGWEEKNIQEAILLFRSGVVSEPVSLPEEVAPDHQLADHVASSQAVERPSPQEPQSLIEREETKSIREELPHNLPLRPFETSEHIWPFSRYRDVFYGDAEPPQVPVSHTVEPTPAAEIRPVHTEPVKVEPPKKLEPVQVPPIVAFPSETPSVSSGDDKLVVLASVMLLAVLLLLGYMYSNGRL